MPFLRHSTPSNSGRTSSLRYMTSVPWLGERVEGLASSTQTAAAKASRRRVLVSPAVRTPNVQRPRRCSDLALARCRPRGPRAHTCACATLMRASPLGARCGRPVATHRQVLYGWKAHEAVSHQRVRGHSKQSGHRLRGACMVPAMPWLWGCGGVGMWYVGQLAPRFWQGHRVACSRSSCTVPQPRLA